MANEIAKVGFEADTSGIKAAKADLDALVPSGEKVAQAAKKAGDAIKQTGTKADQAAAGLTNAANAADKAAAGAGKTAASANAAAAGLNNASGAASKAASGINATGNAADAAAAKLKRMGDAANDNLNRVQATPANIAAQFQDIGVTAAAGMNPLLIALQQGTQLSAAFSGGAGLGAIGAALKQVFSPVSLVTIGVVALVAWLIELAVKFFGAGDAADEMAKALDKVKFASNGIHDAQNILKDVIDETTGKVKEQNKALLDLAKAQLLVARVKSQVAAMEAKTVINKSTEGHFGIIGGPGTGEAYSLDWNKKNPEANIMGALSAGKATTDVTLRQLDMLQRSGKITAARFGELASAVANYGMEVANQTTFDKALQGLESGQVDTEFTKPPKQHKQHSSKAKTPEMKFEDVLKGADQRIAVMEAENSLIGKRGDALESAKYFQELYNKAQDSGIKIGAAELVQLQQRANKMTEVAKAGAYLKLMDDLATGSAKRVEAIKAETDQIGLYGRALYFARAQAEGIAAAVEKGFDPSKDAKLMAAINGGANAAADAQVAMDRKTFDEQMKRSSDERIQGIKDETAQLYLQGEALAYAKEEARLYAAARAKGLNTTDPLLQASIGDEALKVAQATARYDKLKKTIDDNKKSLDGYKGLAKDFGKEFVDGLRNGKNAWDAFGDAALNALNKIIDRLLDKGLDLLLNVLLPGSGTAAEASGGIGSIFKTLFSANGNAFDGSGNVMRYATGGVVSSATPFNYAGGHGVMGEAGPEAILPLTRGSDGNLGVQLYSQGSRGGQNITMPVTFNTVHNLNGVMSSEDVIALNKRSAEQTKAEMKRSMPQILAQFKRDGALS